MPLELGVWRIDGSTKVIEFGQLDLESRLEDILARDITIANTDWMVIGRQVRTNFGSILDLLALDSQGDLIVIELKRDRTPRDIVAQVLDYGAWAKDLKADDFARIFEEYQRAHRWVVCEDATVEQGLVCCSRVDLLQLAPTTTVSAPYPLSSLEFRPSPSSLIRCTSGGIGLSDDVPPPHHTPLTARPGDTPRSRPHERRAQLPHHPLRTRVPPLGGCQHPPRQPGRSSRLEVVHPPTALLQAHL